jgi:hypothetical protein
MLPDGEANPMGVTVPGNAEGSTAVEPANGSAGEVDPEVAVVGLAVV